MSVTPGVQIKCKICGESEFIRNGDREVCKFCGTTYVVYDPGLEAELRTAGAMRESARFEEAAGLYRRIIDIYRGHDLSIAYWNLYLCEQRVMFETDAKGERFPSFFAIAPEDAAASAAYQNALTLAEEFDPPRAALFRELAKKIVGAKEMYRQIGATSKPFDIFICFKKSLMSGEGYTKDWKMAYDLYDRLSGKYHVFFSEKTLNNVVVHQYEPNIYYGLYTAKVMLLLCSKREYLESQWVKNEWSRFYAFGQNPATGKTIIPIFIDDFAPEMLPAKLQSYQGYPADYNLLEHLGRNLQTILNPTDANAEVKAMEARLVEQQAAFEKQLAALRQEMMQHNTPAPVPAPEPTPTPKPAATAPAKPAPVAEPPKETAKGNDLEDAMKQMDDLLRMLEQAEREAVEKEKKETSHAPKKATPTTTPVKKERAPAPEPVPAPKPKPKAIPLTPEQEAMLWVPGSGIGYSTHDYPESLSAACYAFEDLAKIEGGTPPGFSLSEKWKIVREWAEAKQLLDMYDLEKLLGTGALSAMKYKKYNKEYIEKLKEKFWS